MNLWLDDIRAPPEGWTWVRTVPEAKAILRYESVEHASLDHDLGGACPDDCCSGITGARVCDLDCRCVCHATGYELVCWMEITGRWPTVSCHVHSANPVGAERMWFAIERAGFGRDGVRMDKP